MCLSCFHFSSLMKDIMQFRLDVDIKELDIEFGSIPNPTSFGNRSDTKVVVWMYMNLEHEIQLSNKSRFMFGYARLNLEWTPYIFSMCSLLRVMPSCRGDVGGGGEQLGAGGGGEAVKGWWWRRATQNR
jgi:hypothetical protein